MQLGLKLCVLKAGDSYYIPAKMLHFVINKPGQGTVLSVACDAVLSCECAGSGKRPRKRCV
jgi:hypothetical protein